MIGVIKFLHIIIAISLLGCAGTTYLLSSPTVNLPFNKTKLTLCLDSVMLAIVLLGAISGTILVYPSNFNFHTPWIRAAYLLIVIVLLCLLGNIITKIKMPQNRTQSPRLVKYYRFIYAFIIVLAIFIIHDAVTKQTFLIL